MRLALEEARRGLDSGEVPIGAVVVFEDRAIGRAFNQPIGRSDPTAHAEILAMREASRAIGNYRLTGATLYVTLEPCLMCAGAMVFGAAEPKTGAIVSKLQALALPYHNHRVEVVSGVLEVECREIVQEFFRRRRAAP